MIKALHARENSLFSDKKPLKTLLNFTIVLNFGNVIWIKRVKFWGVFLLFFNNSKWFLFKFNQICKECKQICTRCKMLVTVSLHSVTISSYSVTFRFETVTVSSHSVTESMQLVTISMQVVTEWEDTVSVSSHSVTNLFKSVIITIDSVTIIGQTVTVLSDLIQIWFYPLHLCSNFIFKPLERRKVNVLSCSRGEHHYKLS